ncbi:TolC family protein [Thalassoglobus sp. JC818]|uniref:TolC family protein n=1 Tax=Thalassoglobus sp. JC818 TaxID=3232136 RepID=UPI00345A9DEC
MRVDWFLSLILLLAIGSNCWSDDLAMNLSVPIPSLDAQGDPQASDTPVGMQLTLDQAVSIALQNHPSIHERSSSVDRFRGLRWNSTRKPNPTVGYQASEIGDSGRAGMQGVFYSQEFVTANKLGLNGQIGGWEVESARWQTEVQRLRVIGDVRQRFYDLLAASKREEILHVMEAILQDGVSLTQQLVQAGQVGRGELLQAQLRLKENELRHQNAGTQVVAAKRALEVVMGGAPIELNHVVGSLSEAVPELDFDVELPKAIARHPAVEAARAEMVRHQWAVQREQVEPIPNIQSQVGVQYDNASYDTIVNLQLGFELPVNNRNTGRVAAACADYVQASFRAKRLELALREEFVEAFREYGVALQTLKQIENELLPLSQENLETAQTLYKSGEMSYLGLLTAQQSYVEVLLTLNTARQEAWQAVSLIENGLLTNALTTQ